jgi:hypothetical protein
MNSTVNRVTVGLSLLLVAFLTACQTTGDSAKVAAVPTGPALTGDQFKKVVMGNTIQLNIKNRRTGNPLDLRLYFKDEKKVHMTSLGSSSPADESWTVTEDGKFCRITSRGGREICGTQFRVKGDKLHGISSRGNNFAYTLLKGRHTYQCTRC